MKKLLFSCAKKIGHRALCVALCNLSVGAAWAADFYVDATLGNDAFGGSSSAPSLGNGPFKTLARLTAQLKAGDRGLLKCGEVWREPLVLTAAGTVASPIHILSYGRCTGDNKPELRLSKPLGLQSINSQWIGTYTQPIVMVLVNGQSKSMARYPAQDAALTGYVSSSARFSLPDAIKSYTKSQLAGSVLSARVSPYYVEERIVTDVPMVGVAQLDTSFKYLPAPGVAYYLEGKSWMIAKVGDWAWGNDARTQLVMHGGTTGTVEVSGEVNGISLASAHYTSISDLKITNAGNHGISVGNSKYVSLKNLEIRNVMGAFVRVVNSPNITVSGVHADTAQYDGVYVTQSPSAVIRGNVLRNIGTQSNPKKSTAAIVILDSPQATVDLNRIENVAYAGIMFDTASLVTNNVVLSACQVLEDCGYIYTSGHNKRGAYFSAKVTGNLLSDRGSTVAGARQKLVAGIYLDDFAAGIGVIGNYIEGTERGIYLHNTRDTWIHLNTVFDAKVRNFMLSERGTLTSSVTTNNIVFDNTLIAPSNIPSVLVDSSLGVEGIAEISGNNYASTAFGPTLEYWLGDTITRVLPDLSLTHWSKDTLLVANQSACNTSSLYWTSAISKVNPADRTLWKLWSTSNDAKRLTDGPLHVQAGLSGETIVSSPLFAEQAGKDHVLSLSGNFTGAQTRVPVVLRQSTYPYTNRAAVLYVYPDAQGNFNACTVFKPHTAESAARLDIHLKPTDNIKINFVGLKEATYQPPTQRFASLVNAGDESAYLACPFADAKSCEGARLLDQSAAVWPMYMPPRSGKVVYIP